MAASWRGIVSVPEIEDRRPLWQRRTSRRPPTTVAESGSESGAGTTSSAGSRSSSGEDDQLDDRLIVRQSRTAQQLSPIFTNKLGVTRFNDRSPTTATTGSVGRSSSFREVGATSYPATTGGMGGYRRNGSPYHSSRYPPISTRGASAGDHLTADYVPSWKPDRRFSTPAVPRSRGSVSRSPSPRFIAKKGPQGQFQYFRTRAASLPAQCASINVAANNNSSTKRRGQRQQNTDIWPQTRSPSRVEQRFLNLTESADYDKLRAFVIGAKGELVERGFCYRHRSDTASSSSAGSTGPTASPNEDAKVSNSTSIPDHQNPDLFATRVVPRYQILLIGAPSVGKSSILGLLKKNQERGCDDIPNLNSVESETGVATVLPVLICGEEVHLEFYEFCVTEEHLWSPISWQAAIVVYSISDKRSFSSAADALYQIRALSHARNKKALRDGTQNLSFPIPIVLVANKIDLERQRQVHDQDGMELAKSYDCRFVDVSVELTHHVEELLRAVMNEIWRYTVSSYRQNHMQSLGGCPQNTRDFSEEETPTEERKPKRFSFRRSKQPKQSSPRGTTGQQRSSRARSLYTLPPGLPNVLSQSMATSNHNQSRGSFFSRLLGRRAFQSCEDLFSRLLRG